MSPDGRGLVSQDGSVLLRETMQVTGLARGLSQHLARWRAPRAVHDPGKTVTDLAGARTLGGDCLAGQVRDGAWVADITGLLDRSSWPAGMRVAVRQEHPHPGAQPRFTDIDGHQAAPITAASETIRRASWSSGFEAETPRYS